jgi:hypothetical protein
LVGIGVSCNQHCVPPQVPRTISPAVAAHCCPESRSPLLDRFLFGTKWRMGFRAAACSCACPPWPTSLGRMAWPERAFVSRSRRQLPPPCRTGCGFRLRFRNNLTLRFGFTLNIERNFINCIQLYCGFCLPRRPDVPAWPASTWMQWNWSVALRALRDVHVAPATGNEGRSNSSPSPIQRPRHHQRRIMVTT